MRKLFEAMSRHADGAGERIAISDDRGALSRRDLLARVVGLADHLKRQPRVVGLFAPNGLEWAVGQLACALAGKIAVPLPTFFSVSQLGHIVRDASVELVLATHATWPVALQSGVSAHLIDGHRSDPEPPTFVDGFGQVIYTSGSTGQPKGVRHESGQIAWSASALAAATGADASDRYLSVLPLPLLLETICAIFIPQLVGAQCHFAVSIAAAVGRGDVSGLGDAFETHRPTSSVVVPQVLKVWAEELETAGRRAPAPLRFVAVGGAPVPERLAADAWRLGIPAHEGYGLSECCSVVSVNRCGARRSGTVGRPLQGLSVTIDDGEIIVDGPSVTDGYLGQGAARRPWCTGDLGDLDADGFLTVHGRKDDVIVTGFGRNISPEWIETMMLSDPRIGSCALVEHGEPYLAAILIPSRRGSSWFAAAADNDVRDLISECCAAAPDYAVPRAFTVLSFVEAARAQLLTGNGRFVRKRLPEFLKARTSPTLATTL